MLLKPNHKFALWAAVAIILGILVAYSIVQIRAEILPTGSTTTSTNTSGLFANMQVGLDVNVYASATNHTLLASRHLPHDIITNNFVNLLSNFMTPTTGSVYFPMTDAGGTTDYFTTWSTQVPCGSGIVNIWCYSPTSTSSTVAIGVGGLNAPAGVVEYVPITLTNNQATQTLGNTVVSLTIDWNTYSTYLASNVQNVVFYDKYGYQLPAWCESGCTSSATSSVVWVNMGHDTIAASGGTQVIYLGFMSTSTNNFCNPNCATGYWGEYPQATSTYGQYDNGANVFQVYFNFAGTFAPSGVTYVSFSGNTATFNNGVTLTGSTIQATGQYALVIPAFPISNSGTNIVSPYTYATDFNGTFADCASPTSYGQSVMGYFSQTSSNQIPYNGGSYNVENLDGPSTGAAPQTSYSATNVAGTYPFHQYNHGIWTSFEGSNYVYYYNNYTTLAGQTTVAQSPNQLYYWGLSFLPNAAASTCAPNGDFMQWLRQRVAPPNNVMPSAAFGSPTSGTGLVSTEPAVARTDYSLYNQYGGYMVPTQPATYDGVQTVAVSSSQVATSSGSISEAGFFVHVGMYYGNSITNVQELSYNYNYNFPYVMMFHDNFSALAFASGNLISVTYNLVMPAGATNNFAHFMQAFMTSASTVSGSGVCENEQQENGNTNCYYLWSNTGGSSNACGPNNFGSFFFGCSASLTTAFPSVTGAVGTSNTAFSNTQYQLGAQVGNYNPMIYNQLATNSFELSSTWTYTSAETYQEFGLFINTFGYNGEPATGNSLMFFRAVYTGVPVVANGGITEAIVFVF